MFRYLVPLLLFGALLAVLTVGLDRDPRYVPSPLIGKPAPVLDLPSLTDDARRIGRADLLGRVRLINVWASWCVACRDEHAVLLRLSRAGAIPILGLDYKDRREDALRWLERLGNPYTDVAFDGDGRVAIDWGVYGVPETFLVDAQGIIRDKHVGPLTWAIVEQKLLPLVRAVGGGG